MYKCILVYLENYFESKHEPDMQASAKKSEFEIYRDIECRTKCQACETHERFSE